jgi:putative ABC transport system substrate-binding protein
MELLREAVPATSRVATFVDTRGKGGLWQPSQPERWGITFIPIPVLDVSDFENAFVTAVREGTSALSLLDTPMFYTHRQQLADLASRNHLAWVATSREYAEAGALISYGPDERELARRAAAYVARILRGVKPWKLPVGQPTKFELVINLKTAKALGLTIPPSVLARADEIIQ